MSMTLGEQGLQTGVEVELVVERPSDCPIASVSADCQTHVNSVCRSPAADGNCTVAEFTVNDDVAPELADATPVFSSGSTTRYRNHCSKGNDCVCSLVESFDCPVSNVHATNGNLHVLFYAPEIEHVRDIVSTARESFETVYISHISHSGDLSTGALVIFDTGQLTDRQQEVLETAYEQGYFDRPKGANASEVAAMLDISPSTFAEHLAAGQQKLLSALMED